MFLKDGKYSEELQHNSYLAVGVPGTVAGMHLAWKEQGQLPWKRLVEPAVALARDGFPVSEGLALSLKSQLPKFEKYPASLAQFSKNGAPYQPGDTLKQPDLARTLEKIAVEGPAGFYEGNTALALEREMLAHGGLITRDDLKNYKAIRRAPVKGTYRGYDILSMPPISSGGVALIEMLNVLEGYDLKTMGFGSADEVHLVAESMKRAYADRARYLGDPDFNHDMPLGHLMSKAYATELRTTISRDHTAKASPTDVRMAARKRRDDADFDRRQRSQRRIDDLHARAGYGVKIVVPGAGFLLNNEMGDFNAAPGLTLPRD